jgi:hypothetical protein
VEEEEEEDEDVPEPDAAGAFDSVPFDAVDAVSVEDDPERLSVR